MSTVTRYVVTHIGKNGMRTLTQAAQGRYTYASREEAQAWLDAVTSVNSPNMVESIRGNMPLFEVRPCECWAGHHDPVGVWFD